MSLLCWVFHHVGAMSRCRYERSQLPRVFKATIDQRKVKEQVGVIPANCKAKGADGKKAKKACKCSACDKSRIKKKKKVKGAMVAIVVPTCVGFFCLAAAVYIFAHKRRTAKIQRRMSHLPSSMPTVGVKRFVAARGEEASSADDV